jgi:hypothetical protein
MMVWGADTLVRRFCRRLSALEVKINPRKRSDLTTNGKGSGQECPPYTPPLGL